MSLLKDLLFKRQIIDLDKQDEGDWWKSPALQGPENDYGDYDYLATQLPESYQRWEFTKWKRRCENCGCESHLNLHAENYFYTYDGYDSMDYNGCWKCELIKPFIRKLKRRLNYNYDKR